MDFFALLHALIRVCTFYKLLASSSGWPHQLSLAQAPRCNRDLLPVLANALPDPRHGRDPRSVREQTPRMLSDQLTIHEQALSARSGGQTDHGDFVCSQNCSRCCAHQPCPKDSAAKAILRATREQTRAKRGWGEADNPLFAALFRPCSPQCRLARRRSTLARGGGVEGVHCGWRSRTSSLRARSAGACPLCPPNLCTLALAPEVWSSDPRRGAGRGSPLATPTVARPPPSLDLRAR